MGRLDELISEQFHAWERRGRGWSVHDEPVITEPAFLPFQGYTLPPQPDDGRRPTAISRWLERLAPPSQPPIPPPKIAEPEPVPFTREGLVELQMVLPERFNAGLASVGMFLRQLTVCREPITFELVGTAERITTQFAVAPTDAHILRRQLTAYFPEAAFLPIEGILAALNDYPPDEIAIVEFGLEQEWLLPLATGGKLDPFIGLIAVMSELIEDELVLLQVIFHPTQYPWPAHAYRALQDAEGKSMFLNATRLQGGLREKCAQPLYAAVVRIATHGSGFDRAWALARELAFALRVFAHPDGNALVPLRNDDYPHEAHIEDIYLRQSRRSGMLLNLEELTGFVHFPNADVTSPKLRQGGGRTKAAPASATGSFILGENRHLGKITPVGLTTEQRVRHAHIIGASGTGKSTLLFNLIRQDIEQGAGMALLDPHGDLVERILGIIPENRIQDVILVDPSDEQYSVGFNILSAHSDLEKNLLASDLVSVFQRLSTSWGDQMGIVLQNAILAFLESSQGGTLADLRRFLIEPAFREQFLKTVTDPDIVYYWRKGFTQLSGNKSIGPVLTRLETFLSPKPIRYMVAQSANRLDFREILDSGKIFLAKLSQGQMGKENAFLLGSLFVAKFQQLAMGRQAQRLESRRPYFLYLDEFQNFITPSMAEILTGARKYRLGLILAHQELRQLERDREVASAVLSNPYTRLVFRVGDEDARKLSDGFSFFETRDLQNLEIGQAICRLERSEQDFNLSVPHVSDPEYATERKAEVISASRARYATPRAEVEASLHAKVEIIEAPPTEAAPKRVKPVTPPSVPPPEIVIPPVVPVIEPSKPVPPTAVAPAVKPTATPGRGGHQHKAIQQRIKSVAEGLGYGVTIEKTIPEGSVDIVVEKAGRVIAGEISLTTTIDHEVGNVLKCLKGSFAQVAVICVDEERLVKIGKGVASCLSPAEAAQVNYYTPEQFIEFLKESAQQDAPSPEQATVRLGKYKVKRTTVQLTEEERKAREASALSQMADLMKPVKSHR